jgi:hypothetical protein
MLRWIVGVLVAVGLTYLVSFIGYQLEGWQASLFIVISTMVVAWALKLLAFAAF